MHDFSFRRLPYQIPHTFSVLVDPRDPHPRQLSSYQLLNQQSPLLEVARPRRVAGEEVDDFLRARLGLVLEVAIFIYRCHLKFKLPRLRYVVEQKERALDWLLARFQSLQHLASEVLLQDGLHELDRLGPLLEPSLFSDLVRECHTDTALNGDRALKHPFVPSPLLPDHRDSLARCVPAPSTLYLHCIHFVEIELHQADLAFRQPHASPRLYGRDRSTQVPAVR